MSILKNSISWTLALGAVDYLSDHAVLKAIDWTKDAIMNVMNSWWNILWQATPFIWAAAPFALAWYSAYKWFKEAKSTHLWNWLQEWLLRYWAIWSAAWLAWILSVPLAPQILTAWLWMYWVKKITSAISDSVSYVRNSDPIGNTLNWIKNLPWKLFWWIKILPWSTPAAAPA